MDTNEIEKQELKFIRSKKTVRVGFRTIDLIELPLRELLILKIQAI